MSPTAPELDPVEVPTVEPLDTPQDEPTPDTPPNTSKRPTTRAGRQARKAATADKAPARPRVTKAEVAGSIEGLHEMIGSALPFVGMPATGAATVAAGKPAGEVWADAVKRYPQLEKLFGATTDSLILVRLLMVYAPLVQLAIAERSVPADPAAPHMADVLQMFDTTPPAEPTPEPAPTP